MKKSPPIWIWQRSLSPHFSLLADGLAEIGVEVTAVYNEPISESRRRMGWHPAELLKAQTLLAGNRSTIERLIVEAPSDAVHLTQGLARNGLVGYAQNELRRKGMRVWVNLETIDDDGWRGWARRIDYGIRLRLFGHWIERILAIGADTPTWLERRGFPADRVSPFTYFLSQGDGQPKLCATEDLTWGRVRFIFVGQLVEGKCVQDLLSALKNCRPEEFELTIVGDGPLRTRLERQANELTGADSISFCGSVPLAGVRELLRSHDVLVLPSQHDGWGAVVSEALIEGCRVICSDRCGASIVVSLSGAGIVYPARDISRLQEAIRDMIASGPVSSDDRRSIAGWSRCLTVSAGAQYLTAILNSPDVPAPWEKPVHSYHD